MVLLDPWAVLWPGFWLSFGAVAVILFATVGRIGVPQTGFWNVLRLGARTQYVVTLGLMPLTMLLFAYMRGQTSDRFHAELPSEIDTHLGDERQRILRGNR